MGEEVYKGFSIEIPTYDSEKVKEYEEMEAKIEKEKHFEMYKNSGVPEKFFKEGFETYLAESESEKSALDVVLRFASNPTNKVLIFCGNNGNGKTHLGCSVIREFGGEYVTSSFICIKYDSAIGFKTKFSREEIIDHYIRVPMLVIDECCKYFINSELEKFLLVQIVCGRYENDKPTILISNAKKEEFISFMGKAVYDRLSECCTTITFDWESKRKQKRSG